MLKQTTVEIMGLLFFLGCGGDSSGKQSEAIPIYNQAYQEHYEKDTIDEILTLAKGGYVLVDPFEKNVVEHIEAIKLNNNQVAGYISAGTGENYRDDFTELEPYLTTTAWDDWPDEYYVSQISPTVVNVMKKQIDKMADWGLEWVEFDNMDWLNSESKIEYNLKSTPQEAVDYINTLCDYTREKGMKCMAKNIVEGFESFDGVLYESSLESKNWWDTEGTKSFLKAGKLVIINHYNETNCDDAYAEYKNYYRNDGISFICEDIQLKKYRHYNQLEDEEE